MFLCSSDIETAAVAAAAGEYTRWSCIWCLRTLVSMLFGRAQKHVGEAPINSPPDNAQHPASRAMKHVRQDVSEPLYRVIRWYIPATCNRVITAFLSRPVTCVNTVLLRGCCMYPYFPSETISFLSVSQMGVQQMKQNVNHHM